MVKASFIGACIWTLLVILLTVRVSEGRHLKLRDENEDSKRQHAALDTDDQQLAAQAPTTQVVNAAQQPPPPPPSGHVDNFRPTNPGHSPGAGHSMQLNTSSVSIVRDASTTTDDHRHKAESNDNAPSPSTDATVTPPTRHPDDFKPTVPGHSPGAGHSIQN